ncbi:hypothetical protein MKZ38_008869 [Zalerion maritima]|uniref:Uncharacterized protein n=1 Tax=Zalerion maritima TaxID=339359 RepID=A0AAD5WMI6_9PEZI|nr:hypothetical protein MKZ38_008869 [Zalerion maritima]
MDMLNMILFSSQTRSRQLSRMSAGSRFRCFTAEFLPWMLSLHQPRSRSPKNMALKWFTDFWSNPKRKIRSKHDSPAASIDANASVLQPPATTPMATSHLEPNIAPSRSVSPAPPSPVSPPHITIALEDALPYDTCYLFYQTPAYLYC